MNMKTRKNENKNELLSCSDKKERRSIKGIMKSLSIIKDENAGILPNVFSLFYRSNVSPLNIA